MTKSSTTRVSINVTLLFEQWQSISTSEPSLLLPRAGIRTRVFERLLEFDTRQNHSTTTAGSWLVLFDKLSLNELSKNVSTNFQKRNWFAKNVFTLPDFPIKMHLIDLQIIERVEYATSKRLFLFWGTFLGQLFYWNLRNLLFAILQGSLLSLGIIVHNNLVHKTKLF